jgi:hypothetical protein
LFITHHHLTYTIPLKATVDVHSTCVVERRVRRGLMNNISELVHDTASARHRLALEKRLYVVRRVYAALVRKTEVEVARAAHSAAALRSQLASDAPPLTTPAKLGLRAAVSALLYVVQL